MKVFALSIIFSLSLLFSAGAEEFKFEMKGVKVSLISELSAVAPGEKFTAAFYIQHFDDFHTYWRNPGLVGFATTITWDLPKGFEAGELQWQVPERSKMLKYHCHAYKGDAYLLVDIQAPKEIPEKFSLKAKVGGMSCSTKECCKIGFIDVELPMVKAAKSVKNDDSAKKIKDAKSRLPKPSKDVEVSVERKGEWLTLKFAGKSLEPKSVYFYSNENITDTEAEQVLEKVGDSFTLKVKLNKFVKPDLSSVSGLLFSSSGWGSNKSKYFSFTDKLN